MKVKIDKDEWYPVYTVSIADNADVDVNIGPRRLARWQRAFEEFWRVQEEMAKVYKKGKS